MLKADVIPYVLKFKEPGGTSRGVMLFRKVWYIRLWNTNDPSIIGVGECAPLEGLSCDASDYENKLKEICENIDFWIINIHLLEAYPSIRFGLEMSWLDYRHGGNRRWFPSDFTEGRAGIKINGLIWMGACDEMEKRIREKLKKGFTGLKLKIGAIGFEQELSL